MINNRAIEKAYNIGYRVDDKGCLISPKGVTRKVRKDSRGYLETNVRIEGKLYHLYVHQLVTYQKFGNKIYSAECVRHLDGNPLNNTSINIEIGTQSENMMDIPSEKRKRNAEIATSYVRKWDKKKIREYHKRNGNSYKETKEHFGISSNGTLWFILNKG